MFTNNVILLLRNGGLLDFVQILCIITYYMCTSILWFLGLERVTDLHGVLNLSGQIQSYQVFLRYQTILFVTTWKLSWFCTNQAYSLHLSQRPSCHRQWMWHNFEHKIHFFIERVTGIRQEHANLIWKAFSSCTNNFLLAGGNGNIFPCLRHCTKCGLNLRKS